jgi:hypothetical protein
MERYKIDYEKYRERLEELYPEMREEERIEIFEMRIVFWAGVIDNFSTIY